MKIVAPLTVALGLAALPASELRHAPEEGLELTKRFSRRLELDMEEMRIEVNGNPMPAELLEGVEISVADREDFVVVDRILATADGRPTKIARTYESLEGSTEESTTSAGETMSRERGRTSELEGSTVVFAWSDDDEEWTASFDGDGGDEDLLEELRQEMDLAAWLPDSPVEEGDSWEPPFRAVTQVFDPGGNLALEEEEPDPRNVRVSGQFEENMEGSVSATFRGTREEDGREVYVIELACDVETSGTGTADLDDGPEIERSVEVALDAEGELLWDVEGGHAHSFRLAGDGRHRLLETMTGEHEGSVIERVQDLILVGTMEFEVTFER